MINVNQITAELAKMPDAALKQYATMHKSDPYTLSLAMSESNRRQQLRQSTQGQGGQQPTVVDQQLAQMSAPQQMPQGPAQAMPESMGIGTLPQQPMPMAEGGIVAFADGGAPEEQDMYSPDGMLLSGPSLGRGRPDDTTLLEMLGIRNRANRLALEQPEARPLVMPPTAGSNADRGNFPGQGSSGMVLPSPTRAPAAAQPGIAALATSPDGAPSRAPTAQRATNKPTDFAEKYKSIREGMANDDPYGTELQELGDLGVKAKEKAKADLESDTARFDAEYEKRGSRFTKREEDIGKQKNTNTGLAFLNAGLAIMSTPGSLAAAIGKGARVGTEQFASGLDKIRAAQERLDEARDKADDLKLNRSEMSAKEIRQANLDISTSKIDAKKLGIAGLKEAGAKNDKIALTVLDASAKEAQNREDNAAKLQAAGITASAYGAGRLGVAEDRLSLDRLKVQQANLTAQLKDTPKYGPDNLATRAALQRQLNDINVQLSGGTISPPSTAPALGGTQPGWGIKSIP